jgi:hypothetical protein
VLPSGDTSEVDDVRTGRRRRGVTVNVEAPLVLLVLVWAVLLIPGALRSRNASPHTTVGGFERAMDVLRKDDRGPGAGRSVMVPKDAGRIVDRPLDATERPLPRLRSEDPLMARRRAWFLRALVGTAGTFVLTVVMGGWLWAAFAIALALTGGYAALLRRLKVQRDAARRVVRELELRSVADQDVGEVAVGGGTAWTGSSSVRLRRWDD